MADLTITRQNVAIGDGKLTLRKVQVGEAVEQGEAGFFQSSDGLYYLADADAEASAESRGIFLTPAAINGWAVIAEGEGLINLGATLSVGQTYCVSANAGKIAPYSDLVSGKYVTILGVATTASLLSMKIQASRTAKP